MAMTKTELEDKLDKLRTARFSGVRVLTHGGVTTEYKSDAEMATAEAALLQQIAVLGDGRSSGVSVASFVAD